MVQNKNKLWLLVFIVMTVSGCILPPRKEIIRNYQSGHVRLVMLNYPDWELYDGISKDKFLELYGKQTNDNFRPVILRNENEWYYLGNTYPFFRLKFDNGKLSNFEVYAQGTSLDTWWLWRDRYEGDIGTDMFINSGYKFEVKGDSASEAANRIEKVLVQMGLVLWKPLSKELHRDYFLPAQEAGLDPTSRMQSWLRCAFEVVEPVQKWQTIKVYIWIGSPARLSSSSTIYTRPSDILRIEDVIKALETHVTSEVKKGWSQN